MSYQLYKASADYYSELSFSTGVISSAVGLEVAAWGWLARSPQTMAVATIVGAGMMGLGTYSAVAGGFAQHFERLAAQELNDFWTEYNRWYQSGGGSGGKPMLPVSDE